MILQYRTAAVPKSIADECKIVELMGMRVLRAESYISWISFDGNSFSVEDLVNLKERRLNLSKLLSTS